MLKRGFSALCCLFLLSPSLAFASSSKRSGGSLKEQVDKEATTAVVVSLMTSVRELKQLNVELMTHSEKQKIFLEELEAELVDEKRRAQRDKAFCKGALLTMVAVSAAATTTAIVYASLK